MELYKTVINQARQQIIKGDLKKALQYLSFVAKTFKLPKEYKTLALLSGSFYSLEAYDSSNTIDPDFAALQKSRLRQKLTKLADEMEADLRGKKFEIEVKISGPVDKKEADWVKSLFL